MYQLFRFTTTENVGQLCHRHWFIGKVFKYGDWVVRSVVGVCKIQNLWVIRMYISHASHALSSRCTNSEYYKQLTYPLSWNTRSWRAIDTLIQKKLPKSICPTEGQMATIVNEMWFFVIDVLNSLLMSHKWKYIRSHSLYIFIYSLVWHLFWFHLVSLHPKYYPISYIVKLSNNFRIVTRILITFWYPVTVIPQKDL